MNSYLDVFIGEYSIVNVLAELARCLSLFPNLHTVQIDVTSDSRPLQFLHLSKVEIFKEAFEKYSIPQIRNVFVTCRSVSFVASCPQARRVGLKSDRLRVGSGLQSLLHKCPPLEALEDFGEVFETPDGCMCAYLDLFLPRHCIEVLTISHSPKSLSLTFPTSTPFIYFDHTP